jgi:hypothetical protein
VLRRRRRRHHPLDPAEMDARIKRDAAQFAIIVRKANIKPD